MHNLLKKKSAANRQKLTYKLVKDSCGGRMGDVSEVLNHFAQAVQGAVQEVASVLVEAHSQVEPLPKQPAPEHVPAAVQGLGDELTQLISRLHNQRVQLSNSLATLDPAEGPQVAGELLILQNQYNALAEKRRRVAAGEQQPAAEQPAPAPAAPGIEPEAAAPIDRAALLQQRANLRSNISKSKGKAQNSKTEEKRSEHAQKVAQWEVELSTLKMQLA